MKPEDWCDIGHDANSRDEFNSELWMIFLKDLRFRKMRAKRHTVHEDMKEALIKKEGKRLGHECASGRVDHVRRRVSFSFWGFNLSPGEERSVRKTCLSIVHDKFPEYQLWSFDGEDRPVRVY